MCVAVAVAAAITANVNAGVIPIVGVTGHHGGQGFGEELGTLGEMIDLSGMDTTTNGTPDDPSSWLTTGTAWQDEWQSNALLDSGATDNGKVGWMAIDLGEAIAVEDLFIWHMREATAPLRFAATYNIYYATAPAVAPPGDPGQSNLNVDVGAAGGAGDYNFQGGGWTQFGGGQSGSHQGMQTFNLGGIAARYIALEIIANGGDADRVGIAEIAVTGAAAPALPFAITEIDYNPAGDEVSLTWRSRANASYIAKYSLDLADWTSDMGDGLGPGNDEVPDDGDHITVTFDLAAFGIEVFEDLFFRIEEE